MMMMMKNENVKNLFHQSNRQSKKVGISLFIMEWRYKTFFVNDNTKFYQQKHLQKDLLPAIDKETKRNDWIFHQNSALSHRSKLVQTFLEEKLKNRFVTASKWPPNCNLLDYLFLEKIKANVYYLRFFDRAVPE